MIIKASFHSFAIGPTIVRELILHLFNLSSKRFYDLFSKYSTCNIEPVYWLLYKKYWFVAFLYEGTRGVLYVSFAYKNCVERDTNRYPTQNLKALSDIRYKERFKAISLYCNNTVADIVPTYAATRVCPVITTYNLRVYYILYLKNKTNFPCAAADLDLKLIVH